MKKEIKICIVILLIIIIIGGFLGFLKGIGYELLFENQRLRVENIYWQNLTNQYLNANYKCEKELENSSCNCEYEIACEALGFCPEPKINYKQELRDLESLLDNFCEIPN